MNLPPDFAMVECADCGGQFSISAESLYKLRVPSNPLVEQIPACIFCNSKLTSLKPRKEEDNATSS